MAIKRFLSVLLCVLMLFSLAACENGGSTGSNQSNADSSNVELPPVDSNVSGESTTATTGGSNTASSESTSAQSTSVQSTSAQSSVTQRPNSTTSTGTKKPTTTKLTTTTATTIEDDYESKTYYVSVTGSDQNDGLSPERPMQTLNRVAAVTQPGDRVLFKRGDVFRLRSTFACTDNVIYDAYGKGDKPRFYGSLYNYAQAELWEQTQENNLWKCLLDFSEDVCHIVFDDGAAWSVRRRSLSQVTNDLDFFYDNASKAVYLRCNGHPAERFSSIEMGRGNLFRLPWDAQGVTLRNLDFRYTNYAIYNSSSGVQDVRGIRVEYCDFSWIGGHEGHYAPGGVRDGNAIALWGSIRQVVVDHCNFYQIFDAAFTPQCRAAPDSDVVFEDIRMTNCRVEKCQYSLEIWIHVQDGYGNQIGTMRNIYVENNHFIGAGEGFSACQRWNAGSVESSSHIQTMSFEICGHIENFVVRNNIFERGAYDLISFHWQHAMPVLEGNTFIQVKGRPLGHIDGKRYFFNDTAEQIIRQFDKTATVRFAQ